MPAHHSHAPPPGIRVRKAALRDFDALMALEQRVFTTDRLSARSLRHFLHSPTAAMIVAEEGGQLAGTAIVLFRSGTHVARLYSIAVAPPMGGRGVAPLLLQAAERLARSHGCHTMRLEVHHTNAAAISRYRKAGFAEFERCRAYYEDGGDALRFEKRLPAAPKRSGGAVRRISPAT